MDSSISDYEETPLLAGSSNPRDVVNDPAHAAVQDGSSEGNETIIDNVPTAITRRLYISHFLSTWNSRVFEFGAVLYLASIFPRTLLPMSIYALARGASAIVFSPAIGRYIDTGNRLQVVRLSIGKLYSPSGRHYQPTIDLLSLATISCCRILRYVLVSSYRVAAHARRQVRAFSRPGRVSVR